MRTGLQAAACPLHQACSHRAGSAREGAVSILLLAPWHHSGDERGEGKADGGVRTGATHGAGQFGTPGLERSHSHQPRGCGAMRVPVHAALPPLGPAPQPAGCSPGPTRTDPRPHVAPRLAGPGGPAAARAESPRRGEESLSGSPHSLPRALPGENQEQPAPSSGQHLLELRI